MKEINEEFYTNQCSTERSRKLTRILLKDHTLQQLESALYVLQNSFCVFDNPSDENVLLNELLTAYYAAARIKLANKKTK